MPAAGYGGHVRLENVQFEYLYILVCSNGKTYVGGTCNIEERLSRH